MGGRTADGYRVGDDPHVLRWLAGLAREMNPAATLLPAGTVGVPYNASIGATGGTGGYTFSILSGGLPQGLTFSPGGSISGTPLTAGTSARHGAQ